jgi:hypothetical protein
MAPRQARQAVRGRDDNPLLVAEMTLARDHEPSTVSNPQDCTHLCRPDPYHSMMRGPSAIDDFFLSIEKPLNLGNARLLH